MISLKSLLAEGIVLDKINTKIKALEYEWEKLDSQGTGFARQAAIARELQKLGLQKKKWDDIYNTISSAPDVGYAISSVPRNNLRETGKKRDTIIYGGIWSDDRIVAYIATEKTGVGHTRDMGRNRWIYYQSKKTVFWHIFPNYEESEIAVRNYLENRGYVVKSNRSMKDYYDVMESINEDIIMEVTQDQANAALDFLKQMVRKGPFKGNVYLAGGAVRDMIRGETPKDLDVVVTNNGEEGGMKFAAWMAQQMGTYKAGSNPVLFPTFGTANVFLSGEHNGVNLNGMDLQAVFARKEVYTPGSRKPQVFPGTIEDDAFRRDFTVNSLMLDLTTDKILDITGRGKADISAGIIQTTSNPDEIFGQDALRMFRAIRFATKYKWKIDTKTWEGIKNNLDNLGNTSMERVRDELNKILLTDDPAYGMRLLKDSGLLPHISPELQQAIGMGQNKYHKHCVWLHSLEVLKETKPNLINRLMALFHDIGKINTKTVVDGEIHFYQHEHIGSDMTREILANLKYPNEIIDAVCLGIKNHMRLKHSGEHGEMVTDKTLRKFTMDLGDHLESLLDVMAADNAAHEGNHTSPGQIPGIINRINALKGSIPKKTDKLPVTGDDLKLLGLRQGPLYKKLLDLVRDKQLEYPSTTKEEYLELIKQHLKTHDYL
jgi:putative nucleotidyltransferase with HDIG domain